MNVPAEQTQERALYIALKDVESQIKQVMPKEWDDNDLKRLLCTAALQSRKWGRNPKATKWIGLVVKLEEPMFVHILWPNQDEVWTWIHRNNVEVLNESR